MTEHHRNPALARLHSQRAASVQNRVVAWIAKWSGSIAFVYIHAFGFVLWMTVVEHNPWPTLTLVVSLEAIFLATILLINQNRAEANRQIIADSQWAQVQDIHADVKTVLGILRPDA